MYVTESGTLLRAPNPVPVNVTVVDPLVGIGDVAADTDAMLGAAAATGALASAVTTASTASAAVSALEPARPLLRARETALLGVRGGATSWHELGASATPAAGGFGAAHASGGWWLPSPEAQCLRRRWTAPESRMQQGISAAPALTVGPNATIVL